MLFFGRDADGDKIIKPAGRAADSAVCRERRRQELPAAGRRCLAARRAGAGGRPSGDDSDLPVVFNSWRDDPVKELVGEIRESTKPFLDGRPVPELS